MNNTATGALMLTLGCSCQSGDSGSHRVGAARPQELDAAILADPLVVPIASAVSVGPGVYTVEVTADPDTKGSKVLWVCAGSERPIPNLPVKISFSANSATRCKVIARHPSGRTFTGDLVQLDGGVVRMVRVSFGQ
jgi:hypothetical protein